MVLYTMSYDDPEVDGEPDVAAAEILGYAMALADERRRAPGDENGHRNQRQRTKVGSHPLLLGAVAFASNGVARPLSCPYVPAHRAPVEKPGIP